MTYKSTPVRLIKTADGSTPYIHIKYSNDGGLTFTASNGETPGDYMGVCADYAITDPTDVSKYKWSKIKGDPGNDGENGTSVTILGSYDSESALNAAHPSGSIGDGYIVNGDLYVWGGSEWLNVGTIQGPAGADGQASYLHVKYSDDGETFTANNGNDLGAWIGTLVDFNPEASNNFKDYTWKKFTEDVDEELEEIRVIVSEQHTSLINNSQEIILAALKSYVETGAYDEFKEAVETQLKVMAGEITMNFTTTTEQITNVDGDLQSKFTELYKHISFSDDGIEISSGDSAITLQLDNELGIVFKKNGVQFGWWDGEDFHTGNIVVEVNERAQFGNFAFVPRSDGSLSFLKVGE